MKRDETLALGDLVHQMLQEEPEMHERLLEIRAQQAIPSILGGLMRSVGRVEIRDGVLTMQVLSAGVKHALTMERNAFVRRINDAVGAELIRDIRLY